MNYEISSLKNGLRIITSNIPTFETVSIGVWIKTGSGYEKKEINGISHFLEHMVFKGTKNYTALDISEKIEDVGGQSNAYTSREFTSFYAKMLKKDFEIAIDILAEFIMSPTFPKDEIKKEQEVVIQEIKQSIDTPDDIIFDYLQELAFPEQAIGRSILGPEENIKSFDKKTLEEYMKTNYAADNIVVCATGNISHKDLVEKVQKRFAKLQEKSSFEIEEQIYQGGYKLEKRDIEQAHIAIAFKGNAYDDEKYYPTMILANILGGETSSRLFQEIREKRGLVYTISSFANTHTKSGILGIYAGTTKNEIDELLKVAAGEILKISKEKVSEKELNRAKTQFKAGMLMALESSSSTAEILARQLLLFGKIIPIEEMIASIEKVTREDILSVAGEIFSSSPSLVLVGDVDENHPYFEDFKKCLRK